MAKVIGNSHVDRHNARAEEYAANQKRFEDAASKYVADKGYSESAIEAAQRIKERQYPKARIRVGQHEMS